MAAALVFLVAVVVLWALFRFRRRTTLAEAWTPRPLEDARLVYAERLFRSEDPPLAAKVDRVYRRGEMLFLVELKTRATHRVYPSDVIELSAQRVAIEGVTHEQVSDVAWVLTEGTDGASHRACQVRLMSRKDVVALHARRARLLSGELEPLRCRSQRTCAGCGLRTQCDLAGDLAHR
jgi:hypothetical protein